MACPSARTRPLIVAAMLPLRELHGQQLNRNATVNGESCVTLCPRRSAWEGPSAMLHRSTVPGFSCRPQHRYRAARDVARQTGGRYHGGPSGRHGRSCAHRRPRHCPHDSVSHASASKGTRLGRPPGGSGCSSSATDLAPAWALFPSGFPGSLSVCA